MLVGHSGIYYAGITGIFPYSLLLIIKQKAEALVFFGVDRVDK